MKITSVKAPYMAFVDTAAVAVLFRAKLDVPIVDARGTDAEKLIPNAKPLAADSSEADAKDVIGDKDRVVVTDCTNTHCPFSSSVYRRLKEWGYESVLEYPDGIPAWKGSVYPLSRRET